MAASSREKINKTAPAENVPKMRQIRVSGQNSIEKPLFIIAVIRAT
jgi:hypothetical protein